MKKIVKSTLIAITCLAAVLCSGCNNGAYDIYTNLAEGSFEINDSAFKLGGIIEGYEQPSHGGEPSAEGFTTRRQGYYSMSADAVVMVSADFTGDGETKYQNFTKAVGTVLNAVDTALSPSYPDSDINKFNNAEAGAKVEITQITYEVLETAKSVYGLTEGYYNPALYYNVLAYGFSTAHGYPATSADLPDDNTIAKYTELSTHFSEVELTKEDGKYYALKPAKTVEVNGETLTLKLDLGGIGKGYAVDMIDILFDDYGYEYGNFNFGSSSMLVKTNMYEADYSLGLASPRSPARYPYMTVKVRDVKLSTSGDNEQYYNIDGTRYCHIIDATTGKPVQTGIMTATVIGGSAAEDDALTTAIMAMGKERAAEFIQNKLNDRAVVFVCE
ncbi:MAG: FAD:protein FMN transferase [Clostridia bacterium]|nr:FAD:protein FMN transferase [Clostridia bacterium]